MFLLFLFFSSLSFAIDPIPIIDFKTPQQIDWIEWDGLSFTQQFVVERELPWKVGSVVTPAEFQLGMDRLGNLPMFTEVRPRIETRDGKLGVIFKLRERWTIKPVFSGAAAGSSYWLVAGLTERNLLGRYFMAEALYQNFNGLHGGRLFFEEPRFLNTRTTLTFWFERMLRPRPFNVVQRTRVRTGFSSLQWNDDLTLGSNLEVFQDAFYPATNGLMLETHPYTGFFVEGIFKVGRVNRTRILRVGKSLELRPTVGWMSEALPQTFFQSILEGLIFAKPYERLNLVSRLRLAATTYVPRQLQFFLGGADYLRGYTDNSIQAEQYALLNLEARLVAFDHDWIAFVPFVFNDWTVAGGREQGFRSGVAIGAGLLVTSPMLADSEVRVDISLPSQQPLGPAFGISTAVFY